ncbi:MAG: DEAD/DEAH box helicase [Candidatus Nitrosoabyssus spongiisocia]|nr:MAG: DEAD/DEAH box helicase [Nitrosopumilaceae archaeon AB1(1)]
MRKIMNISDLDIPDVAKTFFKKRDFTTLYPSQIKCIEAGLLGVQNMLLVIPTASGKTLAAILGIIKHLETSKRTVVYITPLKALTTEKYRELKEMEEMKDITIGMRTSSVERDMKDANIRVMTNESLVIAILLKKEWTDNIGLIVVDEIHVLDDDQRGPNLEMILTILKNKRPSPRIIGLSATIGNASVISRWLNAKLVSSDWRPVKLKEGVLYENFIKFNDETKIEFEKTDEKNATTLTLDTIKESGQTIVFGGTRKACVGIAKSISAGLQLDKKKLDRLADISKSLLADEEVSNLTQTLAKLIKTGAAFHHAGLNEKCRKMVEDEFRNRNILAIAATPTLAAGVNLPARRIIISNYITYGNPESYITILNYKQMCGRAGRPKYDIIGESIIIPDSGHKSEDVFTNYVDGTPEDIDSKLLNDVKFFTLCCVAAGDSNSRWSPGDSVVKNDGMTATNILEFFNNTLAKIQDENNNLEERVIEAIEYLLEKDVIKEKEHRYRPTAFGYIIYQYMMEPASAVHIREWLRASPKNHEVERILIRSSLFVSDESDPPNSVFAEEWEKAQHHPEEYNIERIYHSIIQWIKEIPLKEIEETHRVQEGDLYWYQQRMDTYFVWMAAIAKFEKSKWFSDVQRLRKRVKYGVKAELLELTSVKQVGRVRARRLYNHGIETMSQLATTNSDTIAKALGNKKTDLVTDIISNAQKLL